MQIFYGLEIKELCQKPNPISKPTTWALELYIKRLRFGSQICIIYNYFALEAHFMRLKKLVVGLGVWTQMLLVCQFQPVVRTEVTISSGIDYILQRQFIASLRITWFMVLHNTHFQSMWRTCFRFNYKIKNYLWIFFSGSFRSNMSCWTLTCQPSRWQCIVRLVWIIMVN